MIYTYYKKRGNKVLVRYKNKGDSTTHTSSLPYKPRLYIDAGNNRPDMMSIYDKPLKAIEFDNMYEAKETAKRYKEIDGFNLNGNSDYANQCIIDLYEGNTPEFDPLIINLARIDIEVDAPVFPKPSDAKWPVNGVTVHLSVDKTFHVFALTNPSNASWSQSNSEEDVKDLVISYQQFNSEKEMLISIITLIGTKCDIISGWNSEAFDAPYLVNRCYNVLGEALTNSLLSPYNEINVIEKIMRFGKKEIKTEIVGVSHVDYMALYKKYRFKPRESYKLDHIGEVELGKRKVEYDGSLYELYRDDFQKFVDYNIQDVNLLVELDNKLGFFELVYAMSYYCLANFEETLGTTKIWEKLVAKFLYSKGRVPIFSKSRKVESEFAGGYVKDVITGLNRWVVSFDLNSLYPHVEMQWNIGPETHIAYHDLPLELKHIVDNYKFDHLLKQEVDLSSLEKYNVTMSPNMQFYTKDKMSFFAEIKRELYSERKIAKAKMIQAEKDQQLNKENVEVYNGLKSVVSKMNSMQMGMKLLLNGGYGAVASVHFLYYMVENAEAITLGGQYVNRYTTAIVDNKLQTMFNVDHTLHVAGDTDSVDGSTIIYVNNKKVKIEDFYDSIPENFIKNDKFNENYVKYVPSGYESTSVNLDLKTEDKKILYVMKHKVNKRMFRISVAGKSVKVTEDHSVMVLRNNKLISVKPLGIVSGDKIIHL